jgi:hypothetical protein
MMPTLTKRQRSVPQASATRVTRRGRSPVTFAIAVLILAASVAGISIVLSRGDHPTFTHALIATARPGTPTADLLALEGDIVGPEAVADPATGQLPDVAAFHRTGISTMRISNGTLYVEFLSGATTAQRASVRAVLSKSPVISDVREVRRQP